MPKSTVVCTIVACVLLLGFASNGFAQTPTCDGLQGDKKATAQAVLNSQHPYECCDETIHVCMQQRPVCKLARRLANDVCRRAGAGQSQADMERALARRATSMTTATKVPIDVTQFEPVGAASAKVQVVAYVCARCPYCARLLPQLHTSVVSGSLRNKARLHVRLFPIRSHAGSTEGGLAIVAAQRMGKFWPFLLHLYQDFDSYDSAKLPDYAEREGMNRDEFIRLYNDAATRTLLTDSKREGVRNKVDATPTIFLNGKRWAGDLDLTSLQDVIEEEDDRVAGRSRE